MSEESLQQAIAAIKAGNKEHAKQLLSQVLEVDDNNEDAWLGMAVCVDDPKTQQECLERALEINPNSELAKRGLKKLGLTISTPTITTTLGELNILVAIWEAKKRELSKRKSQALTAGTAVLLCLLLYDLYRGLGFGCSLLLGVPAFAIGNFLWLRAHFHIKELIKELNTKIEPAQAKLIQLNRERNRLLVRIRQGDFNALSLFETYVSQVLPIDLLPDEGKLIFRPQKGEICFLQVKSAELGRKKTTTRKRKVGGGYRIGSVYVPVRKEQVQITQMNKLDTGTLAITSHRILFLGAVRKLPVKLDKVLELEAYSDALAVTKEGRQTADFFLGVDGELLAAVIDGIESTQSN